MKIKPAGIEFAHIPIAGAPFDAGDLYVSFDDGATWSASTWNDDKTIATIRVGGPDAPPGDYVVLPVGRHAVQVRLTDSSEVVIRDTNSIIEVRA